MTRAAFSENGFPNDHFCRNNQRLEHCLLLHKIKNPDFRAGQEGRDIIAIPHRGLWTDYDNGYANGPPQSSGAAVAAAVAAGFKAVEMDIIRTKDDSFAVMHDYPTFRLTSDTSSSHFIFNRTSYELDGLKLRKRNGDVSTQDMLLGGEFMDMIISEGAVAMVDAKDWVPHIVDGNCVQQCNTKGFSKVEFLKTVKIFVDKLYDDHATSGLSRAAIKTNLTPHEIIHGVTQTSAGVTKSAPGIGINLFNRLQFVVRVISEAHSHSIDNIIEEAIQPWDSYISSVLYYETTFMTNDDVMANSFSYDGRSYLNIYDYVRYHHGLRGGFYTDEPVSSKGTFGRWSTGKVKDPQSDQRADFFRVLSLPYSGYGAFTTDNPRIWDQFNN